MSRNMKKIRDRALENINIATQKKSQIEALERFKKMADYLDTNFPPAENKPQTANPALTSMQHRNVWAST